MKIFELRPIENLKDGDNPWNPWYDKCFGFIVRAKTEEEARKIANENGHEENGDEDLNTARTPWLDKNYSTCVELTADGEAGLIMEDVSRA